MEKIKALMNEYGGVAVGVYLTIFAVVLAGFSSAIAFGAQVTSGGGAAATFGAAYLATKATQPIRILATLGLTPIVGRFYRRFRPPPAPQK